MLPLALAHFGAWDELSQELGDSVTSASTSPISAPVEQVPVPQPPQRQGFEGRSLLSMANDGVMLPEGAEENAVATQRFVELMRLAAVEEQQAQHQAQGTAQDPIQSRWDSHRGCPCVCCCAQQCCGGGPGFTLH